MLAFFILLLGGQLFFVYSSSSGLYAANPWMIIIDIYYWTFLGPALLLYTLLMTKDRLQPAWKYLLLVLPTLIVTIGFSKYIFVDGSNFFTDTSPKNWFYDLTVYVWLYNSPLFYVITILQLRKHKKRIKHYYSYSKNIDLKWLYFLSNGFAIFLLFMLFRSHLQKILGLEIPSSYNYSWLVMVLYVFGIGFYGYKQKGIFLHTDYDATTASNDRINALEFNTPADQELEKEKIHYQKSGLKKEEAEELSGNLKSLMENKKPYLDYDLNLVTLAKKLGTTTHKLSQVLNENFSKNFFDFINEYRIEEVKKQLFLPEKENYKIIAIAYDCGFNSKSTFYTLFKKSTSLTPAEYREKVRKQH
ncbi:helix-turn-helix domain-containing protein [candidate division KSB1 bacterium]